MVRKKYLQMVVVMIELGAKLSVRSKNKETVFQIASRNKDFEMIKLFIDINYKRGLEDKPLRPIIM